jgi:hypothetical protein
MTGVASKFVGSGYTKKFLNAKIGKKLLEVASGVKNAMAGGFRKTGKTPEDKSGFPVEHLGDNK